MKAVIQRVKSASVSMDDRIISSISCGVVILLGIEKGDEEITAKVLANKIVSLRIFNDQQAKMNKDISDVDGAYLVVSQFTLLADCRKGRRPSFADSESPERAKYLYENFVEYLRAENRLVSEGVFQADMVVSINNDGPVTFIVQAKGGSII